LNDVADRYFTDVGGGSNREYTLNTNNNINYIVVYVATGDSSPPTGFQIEEGSKRTGYSDPGKSVFIDFADNSINSKSVKDLTVVGYVVGLDSQFDISFKDKKITTGTLGNPYIVVGSETYPLSEGEWSFADLGSPLTRIIGFDMSISEIVFLGREEVSSDVAIIGTLRTDVSTYDINGNHTFEGKRIIPYTEDNTTSNGIFIADNATGNYYSDSEYINPYIRNMDNIYAIYDDLATRFPTYVSREHLADDEGGEPIYKYEFKPSQTRSGVSIPKVIYTCTHGHETAATYGGALFFKELCERWKEEPIIRL